MHRWILGSIVILLFFAGVPFGQEGSTPLSPGELYDSAMELYYKEKYEAAYEAFSQLIRSFPMSQSVSFSVYMIGQCYVRMEKFEEAIQQFTLYLKNYPDGYRLKEAEEGIEIAKKKKAERTATIPLLPPPVSSTESVNVKRRVCAQIFYLDAKNLDEVEKKFKDLKKAGVDTLIIRVFQSKRDRMYKFVTPRHDEGFYFKTDQAPVVDDILRTLAEIAHRNELDIFAWITTRYADYGLDGRVDLRCKSYNFETKKMEVARGLNLFHPEVLKRLEGLFRDLGRNPIDGILFQDDLILKHNEDFSTEAGKAFLKEFGYSPQPDLFYIDPYRSSTNGKYYVKAYTDQFWSWVHWKNRWLMEVARRLMAAARGPNPNLKFGINLYYETVLNTPNGVAWFSQDLSEALKAGFDYYAVMAYHRQTMRELKMEEKDAIRLMAEVAQKAIHAIENPSKVIMKIQILDWKTYEVISTKEVDEILTGILDQGKVSLSFVPYIEQFPFQVLKGKWNSAPQ